MNLALVGMPLSEALSLLRLAGKEPEVQLTSSPRLRGQTVWRVLRVSEDENCLTAAPFPVPETEAPMEPMESMD